MLRTVLIGKDIKTFQTLFNKWDNKTQMVKLKIN